MGTPYKQGYGEGRYVPRRELLEVLNEHPNPVTAAIHLEMHTSTIYRWMERHGVKKVVRWM